MIYFDINWQGLKWCNWVKFEDWKFEKKNITNNPGIYRIRPMDKDFLMYVGETGRNLRERLDYLIRNVNKEEIPFNDPHTAAPNLWAWAKTNNYKYEVSCAEFLKEIILFSRDKNES